MHFNLNEEISSSYYFLLVIFELNEIMGTVLFIYFFNDGNLKILKIYLQRKMHQLMHT